MRISLNDAFHMMGNKIYGPKWVKSCINLSPGKLRTIEPEECLHFPDLEHPEDDIERERTGIQIASFDQMICYETVRNGLYKGLWNKEIKAFGIDNKGFETDIPNNIWKDITGDYGISFIDSEIVFQNEPEFREVTIEDEKIPEIAKLIRQDLEHEDRVQRGKDSYIKSNRETMRWYYIDKIIIETFSSQNIPATIADGIRQIIKHLKKEGWKLKNIPEESTIRKRIKKIKFS